MYLSVKGKYISGDFLFFWIFEGGFLLGIQSTTVRESCQIILLPNHDRLLLFS